jgi:predicted peroxiredoxin
MRKVVADAVTPVGWQAVGEVFNKLKAKGVRIYACGAYARARGVTEADVTNYGAKFGSPPFLSPWLSGQTQSSLNKAGDDFY